MDEIINFINNKKCTTNCYYAMEELISEIKKYKHEVLYIEDLIKLRSVITKNIHNVRRIHIYKLDLRIAGSIPIRNRSKKINIFNHSFAILQNGEYFTICDSWEGVHFLFCRRKTKWDKFIKWFDALIEKVDMLVVESYMNDLYELFIEEPFSPKFDKIDSFVKDYLDMKGKGEYVIEWSALAEDKKKHIRDMDLKIAIEHYVI